MLVIQSVLVLSHYLPTCLVTTIKTIIESNCTDFHNYFLLLFALGCLSESFFIFCFFFWFIVRALIFLGWYDSHLIRINDIWASNTVFYCCFATKGIMELFKRKKQRIKQIIKKLGYRFKDKMLNPSFQIWIVTTKKSKTKVALNTQAHGSLSLG